MGGDSILFLVGGIAALFFLSRTMLRGRGGLRDMFTREKGVAVAGLSEKAIATLLGDVTAWAESRPDVLAIALVGPFAAAAATPQSDVDLLILCETPERFRHEPWIGEIRYLSRGHPVVESSDAPAEHGFLRYVTLKGAPRLAFRFADRAITQALPEADRARVAQGCLVRHDPAGLFQPIRAQAVG